MSDWETASRIRLRYRRVIHSVIESWVHGPVELLALDDQRELRRVLRKLWGRRNRPLRGWRYVNWLVEIHLCLGLPGDAKASLRAKVPRPAINPGSVMPGVVEWLGGVEGARVSDEIEQNKLEVLPLFCGLD